MRSTSDAASVPGNEAVADEPTRARPLEVDVDVDVDVILLSWTSFGLFHWHTSWGVLPVYPFSPQAHNWPQDEEIGTASDYAADFPLTVEPPQEGARASDHEGDGKVRGNPHDGNDCDHFAERSSQWAYSHLRKRQAVEPQRLAVSVWSR
jgi:hypothetical protein